MNTTASNARLHKMVGCALFAALTAVCSQLAIPMPWGVPINLALFAVYMAGTMLGPVWGAASQLVYLLLAAVGVPVMAVGRAAPRSAWQNRRLCHRLPAGRADCRCLCRQAAPQVRLAGLGRVVGCAPLCAGHHLVYGADRP